MHMRTAFKYTVRSESTTWLCIMWK